jgi:hypothetical protein
VSQLRCFVNPQADVPPFSASTVHDCVLRIFAVTIVFRECLLLFGAESFVFQFAIQKAKDQEI